jgi:hypothetical protein
MLDSSAAWFCLPMHAHSCFPVDQRLDVVCRVLRDFFLVSSVVVLPRIFVGVYDLSHAMAQA